MQKKSLIPLVVLLMMGVLLGFSGCTATEQPSTPTETPSNETPDPTPEVMEKTESQSSEQTVPSPSETSDSTPQLMEEDSQHSEPEASVILQDYTAERFVQLQGQQKFALYFAADWCPSCRATKQAITDNPEEFAGVTLLEIDYDNSKELKKQYGIVSQHSFVFFDANGEVVKTKPFPRDAEVIEFFETEDSST